MDFELVHLPFQILTGHACRLFSAYFTKPITKDKNCQLTCMVPSCLISSLDFGPGTEVFISGKFGSAVALVTVADVDIGKP